MLIVTPNGFFSSVGEPCNLCLLFKIKMITKTINSNNIIAVRTPMIISTYVSPSLRAATTET
jgi:hypothetical protein